MQIQTLTREFSYAGLALPDPNPTFTPEQVRDMYSAAYPEITSASIEGPEQKGDKLVYTFKRAVGTKGAMPLYVARENDGLPYVRVAPAGTKEPFVIQMRKQLEKLGTDALNRLAHFVDHVLFM